MNYSVVIRIVGIVLKFLGGLLLLPLLVSLIYHENTGHVWAACAALFWLVGKALCLHRMPQRHISSRDGSIAVALSWIVLSLAGALPFVLTGDIPNYIDAMFETISGFTTTGASILADVEHLHHSALFWRSFTHWVGGMGVFVLIMSFLPLTGTSSIHFMQAESPGYSVERMLPRLKDTARTLYRIYLLITICVFLALALAGMPLFDNICLSFGTTGTGGFGVRNDSCASYSTVQQMIIAVFMVLSGVNYAVYLAFWKKKFREGLRNEEALAYLGIILTATLLIAASLTLPAAFAGADWGSALSRLSTSLPEALRQAFFQVSSIITTSGFSTVDFNTWPAFAQTILVLLMICGACAGSTGGGFKVSRLIIIFKEVVNKVHATYHPHEISKVRISGTALSEDIVQGVNAFTSIYVILFAFSVLAISIDNFDFTTNFTAVAATLNNIGPGLAGVGPAANFGGFSPFAKIILSLDMLFGRLELFPMILLFLPGTWRPRK